MTDVIGFGASPRYVASLGYWTCGGGLRRARVTAGADHHRRVLRLVWKYGGVGCQGGVPGEAEAHPRGGGPSVCAKPAGKIPAGTVCRRMRPRRWPAFPCGSCAEGRSSFGRGGCGRIPEGHRRMRRPAGPHELKPTLDLHSAPMQPVRGPARGGSFCGAGASRPPKLRSGGSGEISRNTSGCRPGPQPGPLRVSTRGTGRRAVASACPERGPDRQPASA